MERAEAEGCARGGKTGQGGVGRCLISFSPRWRTLAFAANSGSGVLWSVMTLQAAPARAVNKDVSCHHPTPAATILLVDDFPKWRLCVRSILRSQPRWKIVSEACDGVEAVQKAAELQPDLIILDIGLPHMNGIRAATLIRQRSPHSRIVFLSQSTNREIQQAALAVGQADYLAKANAGTELLDTIAAVLAGRYTLSEQRSSPE